MYRLNRINLIWNNKMPPHEYVQWVHYMCQRINKKKNKNNTE